MKPPYTLRVRQNGQIVHESTTLALDGHINWLRSYAGQIRRVDTVIELADEVETDTGRMVGETRIRRPVK